MSVRVALRGDTRQNEMPACKDGAMVSAQALGKIQEHILGLTAYIQEKDKEYQGITLEMQGEIKKLKEDKKVLVGRLGKLESDLKGSEAAQRTMQGTLQQQKQENAYLQQLVSESSARNAQFAADLQIAQREQDLLKHSVKRQTTQLKTSVKKTALQEQLQGKQTEKLRLEENLRTIRGNIQKQKDKIALPTAVVVGGVLGFVTGGLGWAFAGFAAGVAGGSTLANSPNCPCVTALYVELNSAQEQLNLVGQEIVDLEAALNPSK